MSLSSIISSRFVKSPGNRQMGGVMDIFKTIMPSPQPNSTQQNQNPNIPTGAANPGQPLPGTQANQTTAPNGVVPTQDPNANPGNPGTAVSPLESFKDIWQTTTNTDPNANQSMFANLDPTKLMESARQINFAKAIPAETFTKIQAGGPEASQAFIEAINSAVQTGYAQSALATTKIVEQALSKSKEQYDAQLPTLVKKFSANESLLAENPLLSNPAIQPLVNALQEQLVRKNPNATSTEIQQQVNAYFSALGTSFGPKPVESKNSSKVDDDWSKFF